MTRIGIIAGVIIIVLASIYFGFMKAKREHARDGVAATGSAAPPRGSSTTGVRRIDKQARQHVLDQLADARAKRGESRPAPSPSATASSSSGTSGGPKPALPDAPPELTKDYIRARVKELVPLLAECYQRELDADPKLGGTLMVHFTLGGEPGVGGIVETSEIDAEHSTITNPAMIECVRETMYGLQFDPPAEGGQVVVHYPFAFSSTGEPSGK